MGRHKNIDRDQLLNEAENIINQRGAGALTIDAVAKAMDISKGGVQSCFGTKEGLITALAARWEKHYDECFEKISGHLPTEASAIQKIKWHTQITAQEESLMARAACHLVVLMESGALKEWAGNWHQKQLSGLGSDLREERFAKIAYLATEGAFFLRCFGLVQMSDTEWDEVFKDINSLFDGE